MSNKKHNARACALQAIFQWDANPVPADELIIQFTTDHDMQHVAVNYFVECVRGVVSKSSAIDNLFKDFLDRPVKELTPVELAVLRLATYEMSEKMDVPYRVVINEATELTKEFGSSDGYKFVNAVLDKLAKKLRQTEITHGKNKK